MFKSIPSVYRHQCILLLRVMITTTSKGRDQDQLSPRHSKLWIWIPSSTAASETPPRISTCLIFFSAIRPLFHSLLSLSLLSFSVTKLNVTHGGEDSQIYGIKLQITLSSQEILKDVFQMMRRGIWK